MSKKSKIERFSENALSPNVLEPGKPQFDSIKGYWNQFFNNPNDIIIELACGWGEYTLTLASHFPQKNYIGIDIKGYRIWKGSRVALNEKMYHVAFLRTHIIEIENLFEENEVSEIWLIFPDPHPKESDKKHRLSNANYLKKYQSILKKDGWFRFKTDSTLLFDYTIEVLKDFQVRDFEYTRDLYSSYLLKDHFGITTKYEKRWIQKGKKIKYLKFRFT